MKKLLLTCLFCFASSPAQAGDLYLLSSTIIVDSEVIGSPVIMVNAAEENTIKVDGLYELSLKVTPTENGTVLVDAGLVVIEQSASPSMLVNLDEEFSMKFGTTEISMVVSEVPEEKS